MNILASLPKIVDKKKKRVGRGAGSGRGAKSSRGTTRHQSARETIKIIYEGGQNAITKKFPLLRGKGKNKSQANKLYPVALAKLSSVAKDSEITLDFLLKEGIIDKKRARSGVKLVGSASLKHAFIVKLPTSESARKSIEEARGTIE